MATISDDEVAGLAGPRGEPRGHMKWTITWNNPPLTDVLEEVWMAAVETLKPEKWGAQLEETTTLHYQGFMTFKSQKRLRTMKSAMPGAHFEKMGGTLEDNVKYCCTPDETFVAGPWTNCKLPRDRLTGLEDVEWHWWQEMIVEIVNSPVHPRKLWWFWDEAGGTGKTSMAKELVDKHGAMYVRGKANDVMYALQQWVAPEKGEPKDLTTIVFDVARMQPVDYTLLETLKDGIAFNGKYKATTIRWDCPHVICFANEEPDAQRLSADRWEIVKIA